MAAHAIHRLGNVFAMRGLHVTARALQRAMLPPQAVNLGHALWALGVASAPLTRSASASAIKTTALKDVASAATVSHAPCATSRSKALA